MENQHVLDFHYLNHESYIGSFTNINGRVTMWTLGDDMKRQYTVKTTIPSGSITTPLQFGHTSFRRGFITTLENMKKNCKEILEFQISKS